MGVSAKLILNTCTETVFLRLCVRPYYTAGITRTKAIDVVKRFSEKYKHISVCHNYSSNADAAYQQAESSERDEDIHEHEVMHNILKSSKHYNRTILPPIKTRVTVSSDELSQLYHINWIDKSGQDILKAIKKVTYCHLGGSRFEVALYEDMLYSISTKLPELSDIQIHILIQCLITLRDRVEKLSVNKNFLKALDKECLKRFFPKNRETLLLISDAFYQLQHEKSDFLWRAVRKLAAKPQRLSAKSMVQILFLLNMTRLKSVLNLFEIELRIEECIDEMTVNELGIVARGFFLSKHRVKNKNLISLIIKKTEKYAHTVCSVPLGSIMKLVRYSHCVHCLPAFQNLLVSLRKEVPRFSLKTFTHISHAFGGLNVYDELLTKYIIERVTKEVKDMRLKDIERIIYGICSVTPLTNYYKDACQTLANEVLLTYQRSRLAEIQKYPTSLTRLLTFLTMKNIYIPELLCYVFNPKFVRAIYNNNIARLTNELLTLHCSVKIDLPDYEGPLLEDNLYQYLTKKYVSIDNIHKMDRTVPLKTELVFIAKNKLGIDVCVDYILPHNATTDIVFGMDKNDNPINVEPILSTIPTGSIKCVKNQVEEINWHAFLLLPHSSRILGHNGYSGSIVRKIRHLRAIGYRPVLIDQQEWAAYSNEQEKANYLKQQIYERENVSL